MPDPHTSATDPLDEISALVQDLVARVDALTSEVVDLRASMAREIRSRRVVVVEDDGFERIILGARDRFGHIAVQSRAPAGSSTLVELFANDPVEADGANVGMALTDHGEVVATLDVTHDDLPRWWTNSDPGEHT